MKLINKTIIVGGMELHWHVILDVLIDPSAGRMEIQYGSWPTRHEAARLTGHLSTGSLDVVFSVWSESLPYMAADFLVFAGDLSGGEIIETSLAPGAPPPIQLPQESDQIYEVGTMP